MGSGSIGDFRKNERGLWTATSTTDNPWAMPYENGLMLWICRGRRLPLNADWASFKNYN